MGCTHELSTKTIYFFVICDFFSYVFEAIFLALSAYDGFKPGTLVSTIDSPSFDVSVEIMTSFITSKMLNPGYFTLYRKLVIQNKVTSNSMVSAKFTLWHY